MSENLDLLQGTLDLLVLKALLGGPRHGYAVARWIRDTTADTILVEDRALYVALHRLEARDWVESSWGLSENNRRAKFYRLTRAGRRALESKAADWTSYANAVFKVLRTSESE
jgi:transcriptional regulator